MRPVRLEVEGFTSFRERTEITFENTELFVLTGPTGSGKSSLIDAMIFALYGCVPRYEDRRLVAPVISQGKIEAKVRFDFQVDGKEYSAVRVVRRTSTGGATTKEARLECGDQVLAGNEKDLTSEIEQHVVRLSFDHFTKCVVLPQGEFAEFLRTKPSERQDVLVKLLDLDLFGRIGQRANQLASEHKNRADLLQGRLDEELADATDEAVKKAKGRVNSLEKLSKKIDEAAPKLEELKSAVAQAEETKRTAEAHLEALKLVAVPDGVAELSDEYQAATNAVKKAEEQYEQARVSKEEAETAKESLPARTTQEAYEKLYGEQQHLKKKVAQNENELADLKSALAGLAESEEKARDNLNAAKENREAIKQEHSAADLARHLEEGKPCPVCLHVVESLPDRDTPMDLEIAEKAVVNAEAALESHRKKREAKQQEVTSLESAVGERRTRLEGVNKDLEKAPPPEELKKSLEKVGEAEKTLRDATEAEKRAHEQLRRSKNEVGTIEKRRSERWQAFDRARDGVAKLQPPESDREDLQGSWIQLAEWAESKAESQKDVVEKARKTAMESSTKRDEMIAELRKACADKGLDASEREPSKVCHEGLGHARSKHETLVDKAETRKVVTEKKEEAMKSAAVARLLGRHLSATGFERWLLNRALRSLVAGATSILKEDLSDGAYSLALADDNTFEVIDHRNADERRSAKTLSGGETFLASLSLALALANHVGELSAHGGARLDSLFLDEGFGTLDAGTLDTVTAAIQELGARGRMVGIVTHVRELADAIPVQYQVKKVGNVSSVERVAV